MIRGKMLLLIYTSCLGTVLIDVVNHNFLDYIFLIFMSMIRGNMLLLIYISCLGSILIDVVNAQTLDICCPMKEVIIPACLHLNY